MGFLFHQLKIKNGGGGGGYETWSKLLRFPCKQQQQQQEKYAASFYIQSSV